MKTSLRKHPGESEKVITRLKRGVKLKVLRRRGRWIQVKSGRKTGWLTRTTVRAVASASSSSRTRTWKHDKKRRGTWLGKAASASGTRRTAAATKPSTAVPPETIGIDRSQPERTVAAPLPAIGARGFYGGGHVGLRTFGMDFTSDGQAGLGNYLIEAQAATAQVSAGIEHRKGSLQIAAEATYRFSDATPGIRYVASSGDVGDIAFSGHEVDVSVAAGMVVSPALGGTVVLGRAGYSYSVLLVDTIDNVGKLASEDLRGPTVGLELVAPRIGESLALRSRADVMVGGSRAQTDGLQDGATSTASAFWITTRVSRAVSSSLSLEAVHRYHRAHTSWKGPSTRQGDVMDAGRLDTAHTVLVGLTGAL